MGKLIPPVVEPGSLGAGRQPDLHGDGIHARPWMERDVAAVIRAYTDPDIEHWHFRRFEDEREALGWIDEVNRRWREEAAATWVVLDTDDGAIVGRVKISMELADGWGEISYWVLPEARGRGIATRAAIAATAWAHGIGLHRVALEHSTRNVASGRVALAAGFRFEGVKRHANLHQDGWHDMALYSHLDGE